MSSTALKSFILCLVYFQILATEEFDLTCSNSEEDQCKQESHLLGVNLITISWTISLSNTISEKSVSDINSKLNALESTLGEVDQKLKKLNEKKLKMDVQWVNSMRYTILREYFQLSRDSAELLPSVFPQHVDWGEEKEEASHSENWRFRTNWFMSSWVYAFTSIFILNIKSKSKIH